MPVDLRRAPARVGKPYFRDRLTTAEADSLLDALELIAIALPDPKSPSSVLRDSEDDFLVALAIAARADAIVTGDRDLLDHPDLLPPAILARAACELLNLQA